MVDSTSRSEDRQRVRRAQRMDEDALSELFNLYYPQIFRYGMRSLGNIHAAEDLASDVMLKVLDSIQGYRFRGPPFSAWIFRIARNRLIDMVRRQGGPRSNKLGLSESLESLQVTPDVMLERVVEQREVQLALRQLNDQQARVIELRFFHELDTATVAEVLGCSSGAVKSIQHRAMKSLRQIMLPEGSVRPAVASTKAA